MMIGVGLFGALLTVSAAGFGLTTLLVRSRLSAWENLALSWLFGSAVVSLVMWIGGFGLWGLWLQFSVGAVCVALGVTGWKRWRSLPARVGQREGATIGQKILISAFALEIVAVSCLSFQHTLGWDGLTVWEMKARFAFLNGGVLPTPYFTDTARWFSHPEYPLLLPLTETWFYLWLGDCDQFWIKLIFPIWLLATMSILRLAFFDLIGNRTVSWLLVLLFPLVPSIYNAPGGVQVGYADVPLAAIYAAAIFYLLRFLRDNSRDALALFVALAATLPWMKREGAILWAVLSVASAVVIWRRRNLLLALSTALPGAIVIVSWTIYLHAVHALAPRDFASVSISTLRHNADRVGAILQALWEAMCDRPLWDFFWLLVLMAIGCAIVRGRNARTTALTWLLFAPLVCYCASYVFSAWPDYTAHIGTSLPRLLIQLTPVGWLLIAAALAPRPTEQTNSLG